MGNVLLEEVEYKIEETDFGVWRRYVYPNGTSFHEFKSRKRMFGLPLVHFTYGRCPETGRRVWARGVIAVGCFAHGIVSVGMVSIACLAVGLAAVGIAAIGLVGVGLVFGLGQFSTGLVALGQMAIGVFFGAGQMATGYVGIGQIALGKYVLAQAGFGEYVWSMSRSDPEAIEFFKAMPVICYFLP
jgi:hypothetical protein